MFHSGGASVPDSGAHHCGGPVDVSQEPNWQADSLPEDMKCVVFFFFFLHNLTCGIVQSSPTVVLLMLRGVWTRFPILKSAAVYLFWFRLRERLLSVLHSWRSASEPSPGAVGSLFNQAKGRLGKKNPFKPS